MTVLCCRYLKSEMVSASKPVVGSLKVCETSKGAECLRTETLRGVIVDGGMPRYTTLKVCHINVSGDGFKDGSDSDSEPGLGDSPLMSGSTMNHNLQVGNEDTEKHLCQGELPRHTGECGHESVDINMKKNEFPNSQGLPNKDFLATAEGSKSNICVKCGKSDRLLFCGTGGCVFAIHESCLGFRPDFDDGGQFCCPFCAHSRALSQYMKAKEQMSMTSKELRMFLHVDSENPPMELSESSKDKEKPFTGVGSVHGVDMTANFRERDESQENNPGNVKDGKGHDYDFDNGTDPVNSVERQIEGTVEVCPSVRVPERKQDQDLPKPPCSGDDILCEHNDIVSGEQGQTEGAIKKQGMEEIGVPKLVMPIRTIPPGGVVSESDNGNDQARNSGGCLSSRKRKRDDAIISTLNRLSSNEPICSLRRNKVPWTLQEEKALKEGLQKFSNNGRIPWKTILDYGSSDFGGVRTAEDLRNKWKNMCKGGSRNFSDKM